MWALLGDVVQISFSDIAFGGAATLIATAIGVVGRAHANLIRELVKVLGKTARILAVASERIDRLDTHLQGERAKAAAGDLIESDSSIKPGRPIPADSSD